ncbi:MAG: membrane dipeptidase [Thermodesulfobacteriota bacterium]|nr:membrane dipeptidase [Thermodesulfobacteriota bacterium]
MNRREFLHYAGLCAVSLTLEDLFCHRETFAEPIKVGAGVKEIQIIDAHAHPDRLIPPGRTRAWLDESSTLKKIKTLGMAASVFAAVGDQVYLGGGRFQDTEYNNTKAQLEWWLQGIVKSGQVKLVLKVSDVPKNINPAIPPGAILAIEGGDPLEGNPDRVNEFYRLGVRMITLVHYRNNELGDIMRVWRDLDPGPQHHGLTPAGRKVVEQMQELGMMVDVAHAHTDTLKQIVEMSGKPLVDSHTNPCSVEDPSRCGRFRTWKEMELVAKTGGVVCTWPLAIKRKDFARATFLDWAKEILEMKKRLGMEHVGLGTDGGGHLSRLIEGYRDVRDLVHLVKAMQEVGFSQDEISAYMGGNFYRVLQSCIG